MGHDSTGGALVVVDGNPRTPLDKQLFVVHVADTLAVKASSASRRPVELGQRRLSSFAEAPGAGRSNRRPRRLAVPSRRDAVTVTGSRHGKGTPSPADSPTTGSPAKQVVAKGEARGETAGHSDHATPELLGAASLSHEPRRWRRPHDQRASAAAPSSGLVRARPGRETPRGGEPPSTTAVDTASARPPR